MGGAVAGDLADRFGRKHVLVAGWLVAIPVPFLLMWGLSWAWVVAAKVLLGVSQGLTWSTTVIMKIDLVGPKRRGLAMGLNEFASYVAVAASALATGWIAAHYGLRPQPFYLGIAYVAVGLLGVSHCLSFLTSRLYSSLREPPEGQSPDRFQIPIVFQRRARTPVNQDLAGWRFAAKPGR